MKTRKVVAANWKMNKSLAEGLSLIDDIWAIVKDRPVNCKVILCTPSFFLGAFDAGKYDSKLHFGAQDCSAHDKGAYTGEISARQIASTAASYVIIGHSERRSYHHEDAAMLTKKVDQALLAGLCPIFCVGESLEQRENGSFLDVVADQISSSLFHLSAEQFAHLVLAYEPVWAIGTGKTATAEQAQEMHAHIRKHIANRYGAEVAECTSILYGGSCNGDNAQELFAKPDVDGGLIGGASLEVSKFMPIIEAFDK